MIVNKTTRTHFDYYSKLAEQVTDREICFFLEANNLDVKKIRYFYRRDPFLGDLDYRIFDANIHPAVFCQPELVGVINACLWKHVLIFKILGARPNFISNNKFFENTRA